MGFMRARSKEQKDIRIKQIADAALKLYEKTEYEKITLAAIADELSFTRANLYKYIKSKEEIFLYIILSDLKAWMNHLEKELSAVGRTNVPGFAEIWAKSIYEHKRLIELMSILYTVIEKNVAVEKLADFKSRLMLNISSLFVIISSALPDLGEGAAGEFVFMQLYYVMGLYPACRQSDIQKKAIALSGIEYSPPDFVGEFRKFIVLVLNGLMKK